MSFAKELRTIAKTAQMQQLEPNRAKQELELCIEKCRKAAEGGNLELVYEATCLQTHEDQSLFEKLCRKKGLSFGPDPPEQKMLWNNLTPSDTAKRFFRVSWEKRPDGSVYDFIPIY